MLKDISLLLTPFLQRWKIGDGFLLVLPFLYFTGSGKIVHSQSLWGIVLSILLLYLAYLENDLLDFKKDLNNPKKNPDFLILLQKRTFHLSFFFSLLTIGTLFLLWSTPFSFLGGVSFLLVNTLYSLGGKKIPILDTFLVALWGYLYLATFRLPREDCLYLGSMAGVMHILQTRYDLAVDRKNSISTSASLSYPVQIFLLFLLGGIGFFFLIPSLKLLSVMGLLIIPFFFLLSPLPAWISIKTVTIVVWIVHMGIENGIL